MPNYYICTGLNHTIKFDIRYLQYNYTLTIPNLTMKHYLLPLFLTVFSIPGFGQKFEKEITDQRRVIFENVPDGNYRVRLTLGSDCQIGETTVRGESRRLFFERIKTESGKEKVVEFTINKRDTLIRETDTLNVENIISRVRIKNNERQKLNWDNNLSFEFCGPSPCVKKIELEKKDNVTTVFLCGNSTVVDQDNEPWASWGQMIPAFFDKNVCFANYAESGESSNTFIAAGRLEKILTQIKPGDYIMMEFGHNDQKQKGDDKGAYKHFTSALKHYVNEARKRGAIPILITPTQRRFFEQDGTLKDTHGDFPDAVRKLAQEEGLYIIDLHKKTTVLYEALGVEGSKKAFVHYPANSFPGQDKPLADNTHFNPYGANQIAKCVIEGMREQKIPLIKSVKKDYKKYNPKNPDPADKFIWDVSDIIDTTKPDGN